MTSTVRILIATCCLLVLVASNCTCLSLDRESWSDPGSDEPLRLSATIVTSRRVSEPLLGCQTPQSFWGDLTSEQTYCDHASDGIYRLTFRDSNCTTPVKGVLTSSSRRTCENPEASPVQPLDPWPPVGWLTSTKNLDTRTKESTCEPANGTEIVHYETTAALLGECAPRPEMGDFLDTPGHFTSKLCSADGLTYSDVLFSDSTCTTVVSVRTFRTGCSHGLITTCPPNAPITPVLPSAITRTNYFGGTCFRVDTRAHTEYFVDGLCLDGQRMECVTDPTTGTQSVVATSYTRDDTPGECNKVGKTNTYPVDTCIDRGPGAPHGWVFSCPPPRLTTTAGTT